MRSLLTARNLAAATAAAGVALLGASVGGMASVDRELQAATALAPSVQSQRVAYETADPVDCHHRHDPAWNDF
jgi:hypothetical protein